MTGLPGETHEERWATVELLGRSGIGRFRTSIFFPFPGTESYRMALEGGYIDAERVATLTDFTSSSALDFGDAENLFIDKLATCMPWCVNSCLKHASPTPAAARYAPIVERVLAMDVGAWAAFKPSVRDVDRELSEAATAAEEVHYAIRYNAFMGVRSDFFLAEEQGIEWATAAAQPVPERLRQLALAAAANEVC